MESLHNETSRNHLIHHSSFLNPSCFESTKYDNASWINFSLAVLHDNKMIHFDSKAMSCTLQSQ